MHITKVRLDEILKHKDITLYGTNKEYGHPLYPNYYYNGIFCGEFGRLCEKLSESFNITSKESKYFKSLIKLNRDNAKQGHKVWKAVMRRIINNKNTRINIPVIGPKDTIIGFEKITVTIESKRETIKEGDKGCKTIHYFKYDGKWITI